MQGIVVSEDQKYVKAAIVKVFKIQDLADDSDTEAEAITYTLTDENGRFVFRDLEPEENYSIEIHVEDTAVQNKNETSMKTDNTDSVKIDDEDIAEAVYVDLIDVTDEETTAAYLKDEGITFINNDDLIGNYFTDGYRTETELKDKLYAIKNYTW